MEGLAGFLAAALALAGSPGPNTLSLAATGAAFGARRGLGYLAGLVAGMVLVMGSTATGVTGLLLALPGATPLVVAAATAYFVYLAVRIAMAPPLTDAAEPRRQPTFAGGVFLSLVNPKGYAAMAALFSGFVLVRGSLFADVATKTAVLTAVIAAVNLAWLFAGVALTRVFRAPRLARMVNVAFAVLLLVSVGLALMP
ncbi:MAG: LysE family transporter [Xanthobacteraceae bacterium]|nr:LysE family transporter [Xanthobacteraceae bacterium]